MPVAGRQGACGLLMLTQHAHRGGVEVAHVVVAHLAQLLPKLQFLPSDTRTGDGHHAHTHTRAWSCEQCEGEGWGSSARG